MFNKRNKEKRRVLILGLLDFIKNLLSNGKKTPTLIIKDFSKIYKSNDVFEVALYEDDGNPLMNKELIININNVPYKRFTDDNGIAKLNINLPLGEYKVFVDFNGDDEFNKVTGHGMVYVNPVMVTNDLVMFVGDGSSFECKLLDNIGNPIPFKDVIFKINGKGYYRKTDVNGIARLKINLGVGEYSIVTEFNNISHNDRVFVEYVEPADDVFGYWVFGKDMYNVNVDDLKSDGVTDIFLNYYSLSLYGEDKVKEWIRMVSPIRVHLWMQCFYDGEWINPVDNDLTDKVNEAVYYSNISGVAGVHLDYLRFPGNAYKTVGGVEAITNFVRNVKNNINGGVILSCAVMPESEDEYYYGQNLTELGRLCDVVIPMQYKGNYNAGKEWLKNTTRNLSSKCKIYSGLQSYRSDDDATVLSAEELKEDIDVCMGNGASGVMIFRYGLSPRIKKY